MSLVSAGVRNCQGVVSFLLRHVMPPQEDPECLGASDRANVPTAAVRTINQESIESISSHRSSSSYLNTSAETQISALEKMPLHE
ncbi:hypothetical protein CgunFtcFv8_002572 [Champsocephalus gunnari]|uniref:Uncharacterized protein n=1 Tax=Champsocephalus gunnari TaxID=52237 RepID=A0AAN8DA53_CHAGU|nr:hypothetical protein CgunFtcFv8_002572 [Champsocephalus gunnari]